MEYLFARVWKKMKIPSELIRPFPLYKDGASFKNVLSVLYK